MVAQPRLDDHEPEEQQHQAGHRRGKGHVELDKDGIDAEADGEGDEDAKRDVEPLPEEFGPGGDGNLLQALTWIEVYGHKGRRTSFTARGNCLISLN